MDQCRALFTEIEKPLFIEKHSLSPVEGKDGTSRACRNIFKVWALLKDLISFVLFGFPSCWVPKHDDTNPALHWSINKVPIELKTEKSSKMVRAVQTNMYYDEDTRQYKVSSYVDLNPISSVDSYPLLKDIFR